MTSIQLVSIEGRIIIHHFKIYNQVFVIFYRYSFPESFIKSGPFYVGDQLFKQHKLFFQCKNLIIWVGF